MTVTLVAPVEVLALTPEGAVRVAVVALPDPRPVAAQDAQAVPPTAMKAVSSTPTRRARTPRLGAARRARVFGAVRSGISAAPSLTR
ncbi:hypothetical protein GCM10022399_29470 [Terrabacter ginsenosidimutans]|uniref:Uncharacterized protein n=1 Tax=Terrabacter ginsenosidimutans TaxID=490575 RepID=A0ABP7DX91_9MICO